MRELAAALAAAARAAAGDRPATVLIDGRAGSGKTTLAGALAETLDAQLLHLDDLYPGWDGLAAGSAAVPAALAAGRWRRWDWAAEAPAEWRAIEPGRALVVEGCGALTAASRALADLGVWVTAPAELRRARALARDGELFRPHWERWAAQEDRQFAAAAPWRHADRIVAVPRLGPARLGPARGVAERAAPAEPGTLDTC